MELGFPIYEFFTNGMAVEHEDPKKQRAGNAYTGSLSTDPQRGFVNATSFSYRVLLKKSLDGTTAFIVECWTRPPYSPRVESYVENYEQKIFEDGRESLPEIEKWIISRYESTLSKAQ